MPTRCPQLSSPSPRLALPLFPLLPASIPPTGKPPQLPFLQTHFSEPQGLCLALPQALMSPLTMFQGHSHQSAADTGLPPSRWNPGFCFRRTDCSPAGPLPRPLLLHGSRILGQHPRWFPVLWSLCCPLLLPKRRMRGRVLGRKFIESESLFQKLSLVLRLLGFVASARSSPPSPSLPLSPSSLPFSLLFFFFLEGQVLTLHCLLATASTSLSNRSACYGPH